MPHDRPAAGHRVRLALVGFGYWGPNYARVLNDLPDAELTAVCDRSADRRDADKNHFLCGDKQHQ